MQKCLKYWGKYTYKNETRNLSKILNSDSDYLQLIVMNNLILYNEHVYL